MRIGTGLLGMMADVAHRLWTGSQNSISRGLERLSTGLRINAAMDDAAGLAISEGLTARINGLEQGARNAQDGISLVQTAEGGLGSMHEMLQRMRTLAVQAANGTYGTQERAAIQKEMNELVTGIDAVVASTEFNGCCLLDGSYAAHRLQVGADAGDTVLVDIARYDSTGLGLRDAGAALTDPGFGGAPSATTTPPSGGTTPPTGGTTTPPPGDTTTTVDPVPDPATVDPTPDTVTGDPVTTTNPTKQGNGGGKGSADNPKSGPKPKDQTVVQSFTVGGLSVTAAAEPTVTGTSGTTGMTGTLPVSSGWVVSVMDIESAHEAIGIIDDAIWTVSFGRSELGATQNRLEHTIRVVTNTRDNLDGARSRIRDADVAHEMSSLLKHQISAQAAAAMTAQAQVGARRAMEALIH